MTKRSRVMGLPIGRRRTDWAKVGRLGVAGLTAVSAVADATAGLRAARHDQGGSDPDRHERTVR